MSEDKPNENFFASEIVGDVAVVSEVSPEEVEGALENVGDQLNNSVRRALASWAEDTKGPKRNRGIFHRDKYVTPGKVYEQMGMAYDALDDDIVGNVADTSEYMAFQKMKFESKDEDQVDIWNQIGRDLNLDWWVRAAWRELFTVSQFYGVRWWGQKSYKVRGKGEGGRDRRKEYDIVVPTNVAFLDPSRIVPVAQDVFGRRELAWIASPSEKELFHEVESGLQDDDVVSQLFLGPYNPTKTEAQHFGNEDIPIERLMLLNPTYVFEHSLTRSSFERWSRLRMKSVFPLLDLKHQLREMDRAFLLGGINFLVLVTRGTDDRPTNRTETQDTAAQVRAQSKSPIIVTDHRINIEIISPDVDHILDADKWGVLDERIMMRLWGTFNMPSEASSRETSITLGRVIARGLASRRHMLKRTIERELVQPVLEQPRNVDQGFTEETKVEFAPRRMELEFDPTVATLLQELRDRGDISRETILNEFNFDQSMEAVRRELEDDKYEDIFTPVNVPFDSPEKTTPGGSGRQGGRPSGQGGGSDGQE
jgi:hypothetical protein